MELTLAERLLLLALDDESGRDATSSGVDAGLAGALLVELIQSGHLHDAGGELVPIDGGAADPLLDAAYEAISASHKRRDAKGWVGRLQKDLRPIKERVARSLVERGVLDEGRRKLLGLLPSPRFPERDAKPERALRERLAAVLLGEREPDEDDVLLVALLEPFDLVKRLVPKESRKEAKRRAKAIGDAGVAGRAVADSVRDAQAAVTAAVATAAASAAVSGAGGGGRRGLLSAQAAARRAPAGAHVEQPRRRDGGPRGTSVAAATRAA